MILPRAFTEQDQFSAAVAEIERQFRSKGIARIRYELKDDWTGDPSVFFNVLLTDDLAKIDFRQRHVILQQVTTAVEEQLDPRARWGVLPYFNYRRESELARLNDPAWA